MDLFSKEEKKRLKANLLLKNDTISNKLFSSSVPASIKLNMDQLL